MAPLFLLGHVLATPGAIALMEAARIDAEQLLERHQSGDWGDLEEEDWHENDFAVSRRLRTFSAYGQPSVDPKGRPIRGLPPPPISKQTKLHWSMIRRRRRTENLAACVEA